VQEPQVKEAPSTMRRSAQRTARFARWILLGLACAYLASGVFSIAPSEVGVLLRWGRVVDTSVPPGIHYAVPWPVDRVIRVPVRTVMKLTVDDFFEASEVAAGFRAVTGLSSYLLTGDNNIVTISCVLQYSIKDPAKYLFALADSERTLRSLACNTLIHCLSGLTISDVLTIGKATIRSYVGSELQRRLDELDTGLEVTFVELKDVTPPRQVQENFNDVINAKIDKEKRVNQAISYHNEQIPRAKADSDRAVREAEAYRQRVVARAEGDADRFLNHLAEYRRAESVTRTRLHLDFLDELLPRLRRVWVVDTEDGEPVARTVSIQKSP